ncbi:MAG: hypothetical protein ABL928_13560 [Sphingorhabdus sp.]
MNDDNIIHATPLADKGMPAPIDMGPRKVGELDLAQSQLIRARQQSRAKVMGLFLVGLCALFFAITVVRIGVWG